MLNYEEFFLYTVEDLRNRVNQNTPYSIIRACGLCRQLVAENNNLIKKANERIKLKISFKILDFDRTWIKNTVQVAWITIYPSLLRSKEVDRDQFLNTDVLRLNQHTYNVRDIIKISANKMGGVHSDDPHPNNKKNITFYDFDQAVKYDKMY